MEKFTQEESDDLAHIRVSVIGVKQLLDSGTEMDIVTTCVLKPFPVARRRQFQGFKEELSRTMELLTVHDWTVLGSFRVWISQGNTEKVQRVGNRIGSQSQEWHGSPQH